MQTTPVEGQNGPALEVVALGGLGEFGMNMLALTCENTCLVVDAGVMFPDPEMLGVDLIIPDLSYLQSRPGNVSALVLTHGHEDHIGAVPHMLPYIKGPIYGTPWTLALLEAKLADHGLDFTGRLIPIDPAMRASVGPFDLEFLRVTHSMPDCVAVAMHTPVGTIVHTGDYKVDQTPPDGKHFDLHRFAELGGQGVLALFADSTNIERPGFTGSESDVIEAFEEIFSSARGKVVVAAFATSIYRMQILVDLAARFGRKVAFIGRGMVESSQLALTHGHLRIPPRVLIRDSDVRKYPAREVLCLTTGSQGEPMAALSRIAIDDHRHVTVMPEDTVVFSARAIPGNERAINRVINHLARRGADVVYEGIKHVHVSGHGSEEEMKLLVSLVRPRYFVPIHGQYRQRARYARIARQVTGNSMQAIVAEDGDILRFDAAGASVVGRAPAGRILIDSAGSAEVHDEVLRDRRHLAEDGLIVPVMAINKQTGSIEGVPEVVTRGLVLDAGAETMLREASRLLAELVQNASVEERTDHALIQEKVRVELRRFFRKHSGRRPLVLPIVMEI